MLTRAECNVLRGLAIIGIFMHNYCHWLPGIVRENEYQFRQENVAGLWHFLSHPDWNLPLHLFSFFGHYGVPVFLFLSAYGLVRKYETPHSAPEGATIVSEVERKTFVAPSGISGFLLSHFLKLFRMMIVGFVAFVLVDAVTPGSHHYRLIDVVAQLGLFNNVLPHPDRIIWPGPYWFFGLMMQLYIVYRLLLYRRHWGFTVALMVVCVGIQLMLAPDGDAMNRYRYNFMGGMLPFGLGLLLARWEDQKRREERGERKADTPPVVNTHGKTNFFLPSLLLAIALIFFSADSFIGWTLTPLWICLFMVAAVKVLPSWLQRPLEWMGVVSAALFVCHPIARKIIIPISRQGDVYCGLLLYIVASLCLAWLFNELFKIMNRKK